MSLAACKHLTVTLAVVRVFWLGGLPRGRLVPLIAWWVVVRAANVGIVNDVRPAPSSVRQWWGTVHSSTRFGGPHPHAPTLDYALRPAELSNDFAALPNDRVALTWAPIGPSVGLAHWGSPATAASLGVADDLWDFLGGSPSVINN